jgi:hypothetical protein
LLSEYAPAKIRGKLLASLEVTWYLGYILGFGVGAAFQGAGPDSWRWILGSSTIPAIICLILRNGTPESVRWLLSKGRRREAESLVERYHLDLDLDEAAAEVSPRKPGFGALFGKDHRRATIFTSVFWSALVLPYFAIFTFSPEVLAALGIRNDVAGSLVNDGIAVLGVLVGTLVVDRIGRRKLLIPPFWITAVAMLVVGIWPHGSGLPGRAVLRGVLLLQRRVLRVDRRLPDGGLPDRHPHHRGRFQRGDEPGRRGDWHVPVATGTGPHRRRPDHADRRCRARHRRCRLAGARPGDQRPDPHPVGPQQRCAFPIAAAIVGVTG